MKIGIAAVVILYNPSESLFEHISSYHKFVTDVIVVDNSENPNYNLLLRLQKKFRIELIINCVNIGIAAALNKGIKKAITMGADWVITMDQDSFFEGEMLKNYLLLFDNISDKKKIAALGPVYNKSSINNKILKVDSLITSGSLINADVFKRIGGYDEKLFIDEVDNDFCYRAQIEAFNLFQCTEICMNHSLGNRKEIVTIFGQRHSTTLHAPIRIYYIIRNSCYMALKYKTKFPTAIKSTRKDVLVRLKNNLLYGSHKFATFKYAVMGYIHFKRRRFGKY